MKILFVTPCVPTKSDGRRAYNFIRALAGDHTIHLICLKYRVQTIEQVREIEAMGATVQWLEYQRWRSIWNCIPGSLAGNPLRVSWVKYPQLQDMVNQIVNQEEFDVIHFDRMRMGRFIPPNSPPVLVDFTDSLMLYLQRSIKLRRTWAERIVDFWERRTLVAYERKMLKRIQSALVCSHVDAQYFKRDHPQHTFEVVRNVVDTEQFQPKMHNEGHKPRLIITGTLFYFPNVDSVFYYTDEILPKIRARFPDLETLIVGTRPLPAIKALDGKDGVQIVTDVPKMEDYLYADDIYLCPLRVAAGIRNKLLEAMSAGMPVISTRLGAEGLDVEDGKHLLFAETPHEFVEKIASLVNVRSEENPMMQNARKYVIEHHSLDVLRKGILQCYEKIKK